jgi:hypothetical protein
VALWIESVVYAPLVGLLRSQGHLLQLHQDALGRVFVDEIRVVRVVVFVVRIAISVDAEQRQNVLMNRPQVCHRLGILRRGLAANVLHELLNLRQGLDRGHDGERICRDATRSRDTYCATISELEESLFLA